MVARRPFVLAAALLVTACQVVATPPSPGDAGKRPATASERPAAMGTPSAGATAGAAAQSGRTTPAPTGPVALPALAKLARTPGTRGLAGHVAIDGAYMVAAGAGNVLSHNGGAIVAAGGLNLIGQDGGSLIGQDGGSLVAAGAGNAVAAVGDDGLAALKTAGSGLVGNSGNTLIGNSGNTLIGQDGGSLVGNNGNSLVGNSGNTYWLAQAGAATGSIPAVGLMVSVRRLADGSPVPLGKDGQGRTVWAVYTDAAGGYDVELPVDLAENLLVVAEAPFRGGGRLALGRISEPGETAADVDGVSTAVMRALRVTIRGKFEGLLANVDRQRAEGLSDDAIVEAFFHGSKSDPAAVAALAGPVRKLLSAVAADPAITPDDYPGLALAMADRVLGRGASLKDVAVRDADYRVPADLEVARKDALYGKSALVAMEGIFRDVVGAVERRNLAPAALMASFRDAPYVALANRFAARRDPRGPSPRYAIATPGDLADLVVHEYLTLVPGGGYGCDGAGCAPLPLECDLVASRLACFPAQGAGPLTSEQIRDLVQAVFTDLGLPPARAAVLDAAGAAFGIQNALAAALRVDELECTIRRYKHPEAACNEGLPQP